jgi:hypothetical protein
MADKDSNADSLPKLKTLNPKSDLIIVDGPKRLLVSSNILSLASGYFRRRLQEDRLEEYEPHYRTGRQTITLHNNDPDAFYLMCKMLHFQTFDAPVNDVNRLGALADTWDHYEC